MPRKANAPAAEEGGGESVGLWYVSFTDMVTLLLAFFVMLATFSSYSKDNLDRFAGAWTYLANYSILPGKNVSQESVVQMEKYMDWTPVGSEKPSHTESTDAIRAPRESFWMENMANAYHERRTFMVPSVRLFWGNGSSLIPTGKSHLDMVVSFLKVMPGQVIVGESAVDDGSGTADGRSLSRSWEIVEYMARKGNLPYDRFSVGVCDDKSSRKVGGAPVTEITLLAGNMLKKK